MTEDTSKNNASRYIAVVLAIVIFAFVTISGCTTNKPPEQQETLLTVTVGSQSYNYTLDDLTTLKSITGQGSYINKAGTITGPNNYTGVTVSVLFSTIPDLAPKYGFQAIASDNYTVNYSLAAVDGQVPVFNETGSALGTGNMTMLIAYKENGVFLNESTKGPLRIVFIDKEGAITQSSLWLSSLVEIQIID